MNTNNERIDVKVVMLRDAIDASISRHWDGVAYAEQCGRESDEARAAVAELIEAAAGFMRPAATVSEMVEQLDRLRAALARVGAP